MRFLLSFILAAFASRLKPIVSATRARCADMSFLKTPPVLYGR